MLLVRYALKQWPVLGSILALTLTATLVAVLQPWPVKILVDNGLKHETVPQWLASFISLGNAQEIIIAAALASIVLFAISSAIDAALNWAWSVAGCRMANGLAVDMFHNIQRRQLSIHNLSNIGDLLNRITGDSWCVQEVTASLVISPIKNVFALITLGLAGWRLNPQLGMLSLLLAPVLAFSSWFFGRKMKARARQVREAQSHLSSFIQQTLTTIPLVQAFGREDLNRKRFEYLAGDAVDHSRRRAVLESAFGMTNGLLTTIGVAVVLLAGGRQVLSGSLTLGGLLVFLAYMRNLQAASEALLGVYGTMKPVEASIDRVMEILCAKDGISERPCAPPLPDFTPAGRIVRFENVSFGYEPGRLVLSNISLTARPGEIVALVGATGAGKSTLASLIPRFTDVCEGSVVIDGIDVRNVQLESLRSEISVVLQEPFILPLTIAENIAYAKTGVQREQIIAAARAANAHEFIEGLPNGYDTVVGQRGATLSGGEKQRLAIARAILRDTPIFIFDEPTSAVDALTEESLVKTIERLKPGKTIFVIAHRLSTIRRADKIIVLEGGRIVETGTHDQLLQSQGAYSRYSLMHRRRAEGIVA
jgi:ATP-binding cassette subfamily B protein/subfamily B ATP-binding cassette protein MsbA